MSTSIPESDARFHTTSYWRERCLAVEEGQKRNRRLGTRLAGCAGIALGAVQSELTSPWAATWSALGCAALALAVDFFCERPRP